jgi:FKBP-type peptidyl-prolyl cis-trans isomerase SlyD
MNSLEISKNTVVSLFYSVKDAASDKILQQQLDEPQEFLIGHQLLIDTFEDHLLGLITDQTFKFVVPKDQAYGPIDPHAIFDLPISTFEEEDGTIDEEVVQVGHVFPMADKDGNRHYGKIIRKMKDSVTMDFNHPMAGRDLLFEGRIVAVREARPDEIPLD